MYKQAMFIFLCLCMSCGIDNSKEKVVDTHFKSDLDSVNWILGDWYQQTSEGIISEFWAKDSDTSFKGQGAVTSMNGDTLFKERIRLVASANALWYIPTVDNQNNGSEVPFKQKRISANEMVFENPEHDFPQRIIYQKLSDSTIYARVEGMQNGQLRKEVFNYKRRR